MATLVPSLNSCLPRARVDLASEAKLLYVAMTRATERLMVTAHERNDFVERLVA